MRNEEREAVCPGDCYLHHVLVLGTHAERKHRSYISCTKLLENRQDHCYS